MINLIRYSFKVYIMSWQVLVDVIVHFLITVSGGTFLIMQAGLIGGWVL